MDNSDIARTAEAVLDAALRAGATSADVIAVTSQSHSVQVRLGETEEIERDESSDIGLRVFAGQASAIVSTSNREPEAIEALAERAVAIARAAPEDSFAGLAPADELATAWPDLDLADPTTPDIAALTECALEAEDTARALDGITNSQGAGASASRKSVALLTSAGFSGAFQVTRHSLSCSVVAGTGTGMQGDYDYSAARHFADLDTAADIGRRAGERALRMVGAGRIKTGPVTVVFEPRTAASLIGHLTGAINGRAIARRSSFLHDAMGKQVFPPGVTIVDDPLRPRGLNSRPFDVEGLKCERRDLVRDGRIATWLLDLATARQLGLSSTGHAVRGVGSAPSPAPSNVTLEPGSATPNELISGVAHGIYVTGLIGMGVNGVTGDYSRGVEGLAIENGELAGPVNEVTIAGSLQTMFANLVVANDLEIRTGRDAPSVLIEGMTLAGS